MTTLFSEFGLQVYQLKACIARQGEEIFMEKKNHTFVFSCGIIISTKYCLCPVPSFILPDLPHTAVVGVGHMAVPILL